MKLDLDDIIHIDIEHCYVCGIELTPENKSEWRSFAKINNDIVTVNQCKQCNKKNSPVGEKIGE